MSLGVTPSDTEELGEVKLRICLLEQENEILRRKGAYLIQAFPSWSRWPTSWLPSILRSH